MEFVTREAMVKPARLFILTVLAMIAFAGNSLLCRLALKETGIDAASFTFIRLLSGAVALWLIVKARKASWREAGNWISALPTVQLSVPVLAAAGGILLLGEPVTLRFLIASMAVLGGIALVVLTPRRS